MLRCLTLILLSAVATSTAVAADYDFDGALEAGDQQNENRGYADAYNFDANAGDTIRFAITGMKSVVPHAAVLDASGTSLYTTQGFMGELTVNWTAKETGSYTFLVTQDYPDPTPYHLRISN